MRRLKIYSVLGISSYFRRTEKTEFNCFQRHCEKSHSKGENRWIYSTRWFVALKILFLVEIQMQKPVRLSKRLYYLVSTLIFTDLHRNCKKNQKISFHLYLLRKVCMDYIENHKIERNQANHDIISARFCCFPSL